MQLVALVIVAVLLPSLTASRGGALFAVLFQVNTEDYQREDGETIPGATELENRNIHIYEINILQDTWRRRWITFPLIVESVRQQ